MQLKVKFATKKKQKKKQSSVVYKLVTISPNPAKPLLFHSSYFLWLHRHILYNRRNASQDLWGLDGLVKITLHCLILSCSVIFT